MALAILMREVVKSYFTVSNSLNLKSSLRQSVSVHITYNYARTKVHHHIDQVNFKVLELLPDICSVVYELITTVK